jgi:FkbM family methyltransferase
MRLELIITIILCIVISITILYIFLSTSNYDNKYFHEINPIDGKKFIWDSSDFVKNNWPNIDFSIDQKKEIFQMAKKLEYNAGIIDVGAHIGDLSIPLALALKNIKRDDIFIYAIDPSIEKCEFMKKIATLNSINNIKIINVGLSNVESIYKPQPLESEHAKINNTGATIWKKDTDGVKFVTADSLIDDKIINHNIGLYLIDVETHEIEVINGSRQLIYKFNPILCVEVFDNRDNGRNCDLPKNEHEKSNHCNDLFKLLEDLNYRVSGKLANLDLICTPVNRREV